MNNDINIHIRLKYSIVKHAIAKYKKQYNKSLMSSVSMFLTITDHHLY